MDNNTALNVGVAVRGPRHLYRIIRVLGCGGFGMTYLVETQIRVGNIPVTARFAMKEHFISSLCNRAADSCTVQFSQPVATQVCDSLNAFRKEALRLQSLRIDSPNIIKINEVFSANNTAYYIMEYIEGEDLHDYVARTGPLSQADTAAVMSPVIRAVAALHAARVTHYDIKPANIMLRHTSDGTPDPVLIDFGLSKHYDELGKATSTIATAGLSPGYAPIEQYAPLREFSPQSDVYALAATLFYCLTGKRPPDAINLRHDFLEQCIAPKCDRAWRDAIHHAMTQSREARTPDASHLLAELGISARGGMPFSRGRYAQGRPEEVVETVPASRRQRNRIISEPRSYSGSMTDSPELSEKGRRLADSQISEYFYDVSRKESSDSPDNSITWQGCLILSILLPLAAFIMILIFWAA